MHHFHNFKGKFSESPLISGQELALKFQGVMDHGLGPVILMVVFPERHEIPD